MPPERMEMTGQRMRTPTLRGQAEPIGLTALLALLLRAPAITIVRRFTTIRLAALRKSDRRHGLKHSSIARRRSGQLRVLRRNSEPRRSARLRHHSTRCRSNTMHPVNKASRSGIRTPSPERYKKSNLPRQGHSKLEWPFFIPLKALASRCSQPAKTYNFSSFSQR
jgi:hypothetical protein